MIEKDKVVQFHYVLSDDSGQQLESSHNGSPMAYLHGYKNIIAGLEEAMVGKAEGDAFTATIPPEKGYGVRNEELTQRIPVKHLQGAKKWKPGMIAWIETDQGQRQVTVIKMGKFMVTVDANHPLAGRTLTFKVEVQSVRDASEEEISHGHAHGEGGHQH